LAFCKLEQKISAIQAAAKSAPLFHHPALLSSLVDLAARGKSIVIAKSVTPLARLRPLSERAPRKIRFGFMKGEITIADDFDALASDVFKTFDGE